MDVWISWIRAHKSLSKCQDELQSRPKGKGPRATDPASGLEASADEAGQDEPQVSTCSTEQKHDPGETVPSAAVVRYGMTCLIYCASRYLSNCVSVGSFCGVI